MVQVSEINCKGNRKIHKIGGFGKTKIIEELQENEYKPDRLRIL
jgi:hypothetical protein